MALAVLLLVALAVGAIGLVATAFFPLLSPLIAILTLA